jgi:hypothetical protein
VEEFDGYTSPSKLNFDTTAFWIRMYDLPLMCMGREMGFKLGSTIGKVEEVKTNDDGVGWGEYLRVRVHLNLFKPIPRGQVLMLKNQSIWVAFQYERVPKEKLETMLSKSMAHGFKSHQIDLGSDGHE